MQITLRSHMLQTRVGAFAALAAFGVAAAPAAHAQRSFQAAGDHSTATQPTSGAARHLTHGGVSRRIIPVGKEHKKAAGLGRWIACKWDLVGVVGLIASSAVYGVHALAHTGL